MASRNHSRWGGVRDAKSYFTGRNYFVTLIIFYKFNSTDELSESWGGVHPPHPPARYAPGLETEHAFGYSGGTGSGCKKVSAQSRHFPS